MGAPVRMVMNIRFPKSRAENKSSTLTQNM